jgi:ATP-dependent helicase/nuclease subunit B
LASSEPRGRLFAVPPHRPFADDLAAGLLARHPDPLELARLLLLLPTRRAVRAVADAFVRQSDGQALLLPRLAPVGDIDADLEDRALGSFAEGLEGPAEAAPAISPLARQLALARLLARARSLPGAEALAMAAELGAALDTLTIEEKRAADLDAAIPVGDLQAHWAINARIIEAIARDWPSILADRGSMDAAARRNLLLRLLAARWADAPPAHAVVMAGFASAPPAVAALARSVARLPGGLLLLPGLDLDLPRATAERIAEREETHPQYGMLRLLADAGLSPAEAAPWPHAAPAAGSPPARAALVARALLPPAFSGAALAPADPQALAGIRFVEAASPAEEALAIAIALRQVAGRPGLTAALVTPDRALARRVAVQLGRFGIDVDDSAGEPLAVTAPGSLLVALASAAAERFAPVPLVALLQHPLVAAGDGRLQWLNHVRALDRLALRGLRPAPGLAGLARRLAQRESCAQLRDWWREEVAPKLASLEPLPADASALVDALVAVAQALAGDELWQGEAGHQLATLIEALDEGRADLSQLPVDAGGAAVIAGALMAGATVRPRWRKHPQLAIWGPLEARLQSADLMVLGGLNEGHWPALPAPDPFLAPAIRRALGLPGLARRTGMQAHDLVMGMGAPEVLVTRAAREGGAPSVPSRFWQRLVAAAGCVPDSGNLTPPTATLLAAARTLDTPAQPARFDRPAPAPPAADRPRKLSVTEVATLKADPFAFYAKHMLKLAKLDPRDAEPTSGDRGSAVHKVLERWFADPARDPAALDRLIDEEIARLGDRPELAALWRPRVVRMVDFVLEEAARDRDWTPLAGEAAGELVWRGIRLKGLADRVDRRADGALRLLDYKTGGLPGVADVAGLWQTQLALLAHMAEAGAMPKVPAAPVVALDYLKLSGGREPGELRPALGKRVGPDAIAPHVAEAWADFEDQAASFLLGERPFTAKLNLVHGRRFGDYDHLARVAEWLGRA